MSTNDSNLNINEINLFILDVIPKCVNASFFLLKNMKEILNFYSISVKLRFYLSFIISFLTWIEFYAPQINNLN